MLSYLSLDEMNVLRLMIFNRPFYGESPSCALALSRIVINLCFREEKSIHHSGVAAVTVYIGALIKSQHEKYITEC